MSRRPNIETEHEKEIERRIQEERAERDRHRASGDGAAEDADLASVPDPAILSVSRGPVEGTMPEEAARWIEEEAADQEGHYRRIYREVEALAPERDRWVEEFFERITGPRGFSVHAGTRKTIPRDEIPQRPDRPWRIVW